MNESFTLICNFLISVFMFGNYPFMTELLVINIIEKK